MQWAKEQGAVTGYAHSANGLEHQPAEVATRGCSPSSTRTSDGVITQGRGDGRQVAAARAVRRRSTPTATASSPRPNCCKSTERTRDKLPNLAIPRDERHRRAGDLRHDRDGRVRLHQRDGHRPRAGVELLVPHHELRLPAEGVAARPTSRASAAAASARAASTCSSARSTRSTYAAWCNGIAKGRSYVSDGYAHALEFTVNGTSPGFGEVKLDAAGQR